MTFTLLIAEDDVVQAKLLARIAAEAGFDITVVHDGDIALSELSTSPPDALFTDLRLPGADGLALIATAREADSIMPVILSTGYATAHNAVEAFHLGVMDVLIKPLELDALRLTFKRLRETLAQRRRIDQLSAQLATHAAPPLMDSSAPAMKQCLQLAAQIADKELPVLLEGETGAGKGVVAAHIHGLSRRSEAPSLPSTVARCPPPCWNLNSSASRKAPSPVLPHVNPACWNWRMAAPCSWTRSTAPAWMHRPGCCNSFKTDS